MQAERKPSPHRGWVSRNGRYASIDPPSWGRNSSWVMTASGRYARTRLAAFGPYTALPSLSHSAFPYLNGTPIATRRTTTSPTANRNSCGLSSADSFFGIWCWRVLCYWPSPQPSPARGRGGRACLVGRAPRSGAAWSDVYPPLAPGIWNLESGIRPPAQATKSTGNAP